LEASKKEHSKQTLSRGDQDYNFINANQY